MFLTPFIPVVAFIINVVSQVLIFRYVKEISLLKSIFLSFGIGFSFLVVIELLRYGIELHFSWNFISIAIVNVLTYSALGYCYFHFINLGVTARRIRLLIEIMNSNNGLTIDEVLNRYNASEMIRNRLGRLLKSGQIVYKDGRYFIGKPVMLVIAKIMVVMKLLLLGKRSEFE